MDVASSVIKTNNRISVATNVTFLYTPSSFSGGIEMKLWQQMSTKKSMYFNVFILYFGM